MSEKKVKLEKTKEKKVKEKKVKEKKNGLDVKKLKNYFNKNTFLGITLVGMVVLVLVYVFVFLDYQEKTTEVQAANDELSKSLKELEEYFNNMEKYQAEISEYKMAISDIMSEYPADAREEDIIMLAVQMQEKNAITYESISMDESEMLYYIPADEIAAADIEGFTDELVFEKKTGTYLNTTNYDNLKGCIAQIYDSDNRIGIEEILYSKNESDGTLDGNIVLSFYSAKGTGKEYEAPDIAKYLSGTDDLFRTDKVAASGYEPEGDGEGDENADETGEGQDEQETR